MPNESTSTDSPSFPAPAFSSEAASTRNPQFAPVADSPRGSGKRKFNAVWKNARDFAADYAPFARRRIARTGRRLLLRGIRVGRAARGRLARVFSSEPRVQSQANVDPSEAMPRISFNANWKLPPSRHAHLMVHDIGPSIDDVAEAFVQRLRGEAREDVTIGEVAEMETLPGSRRAFRIAHRIAPGHNTASDVVFQTMGNELYLSQRSRARTHLAYLNYGLRAAALVGAVAVALWLYLIATGARASWIKDYVDRHVALVYNEKQSPFMMDRLVHGGATIHWADFTQSIWADEETSYLVQEAFGALRRADPSDAFGSIANSLSIARVTSWGEHMFQYIATESWLKKIGNKFFAWYDAGRPIVLDANVFGVNVRQSTDAHAWTSLELPSIDPIVRELEAFGQPLGDRLICHLRAATTHTEPWSILKLASQDPRTALFNIGMPLSILGAIVGFLVWRAPRAWLRVPCHLLGWPTPDDFDTAAVARSAWIERQMSQVLADFGIGKSQISDLQAGVHHAS